MTAALEGIKIVDLARTGPGQWVTTHLADLGADVTAIEQPGFAQRRTAHGSARAGFAMSVGRNKRSILLNLADERGREVFFRLAGDADVVMESFRPGSVKRLGIDYEAVRAVNPKVIYCSLSGFGQTGPYAMMPAHDIQFEAVGGLLSTDAEGRPQVPANIWADRQATNTALIAILTALVARERLGVGQYLDVSYLDGAVTLPMRHWDEMLAGAYPCYNVYECADGRYVALGIREPWFWERMCKLLGREDWIPHQRPEGALRDEMFAVFRDTFRSRSRDEWARVLQEHDIEGSPVNMGEDVLHDPQIKARGMLVEVRDNEQPPAWQLGSFVKLSETPWQMRHPFTHLGQDTDAVLTELGYGDTVRRELREAGVIE